MKKILGILISLCLIAVILPTTAFAEGNPEAAIGEIRYNTLQDAINNTKDGDMVTLLRNVSLKKDSLLTLESDTPKAITIDLNQKEICYPNDEEWETAALTIAKPVTLTITNGKIDVGDDDHTAIKIICAEENPVRLMLSNVAIQSGYAAVYTELWNTTVSGKNYISLEDVDIISRGYGINAESSDVTFESGKITSTDDETFYLSNCSLTVNSGEFLTTGDGCAELENCSVTINGGHFTSKDGSAIEINDSDAMLNGGTFEGPEKAIEADDESKVILGENLKTLFSDGTTLEDFMNSPYVQVEKTNAVVTFISEEEKVAEVLVRKGHSISGNELGDRSMPDTPKKSGYSFKEWRTAKDGTGDVFTDTTIVTNDLTVYAVFNLNWTSRNEVPILEVQDKTIKAGESLDLRSLLVSAMDKEDGNLMDKVEIIDDGGFNSVKAGKYTIWFKVTDSSNASVQKAAVVTVTENVSSQDTPSQPDTNPDSSKPGDENLGNDMPTTPTKVHETVCGNRPGGSNSGTVISTVSTKNNTETSPKTGDDSNAGTWFALLIISSGALIETSLIAKKKKRSR